MSQGVSENDYHVSLVSQLKPILSESTKSNREVITSQTYIHPLSTDLSEMNVTFGPSPKTFTGTAADSRHWEYQPLVTQTDMESD